MNPASPAGPTSLPNGTELLTVSGRGLTLRSPEPVAAGSVLEFDLLLGMRPIPVMARVTACRETSGGKGHELDVEFVALAQMDRDSVTDFLQAVGPRALSVREHREG